MKTTKTFCTLGPFPLELVGEAISQFEKQGWKKEEVLFTGMMQPNLVVPNNPQSVPVYAVLLCKWHPEDEKVAVPEFKMPKINMAKPPENTPLPTEAADESDTQR